MAAKKKTLATKTKKAAEGKSSKAKEETFKPGPEAKLLLLLSPIADDLRVEFRAQRSEAECEALGKNTSSAGVYREAGQVGVVMHKTLATHGAAKVRYGLGALVWYLETVQALGAEITRQSSRAKAASTSSLTGQLSLDVAREQRSAINELITSIIEGDDVLEASFQAVRGGASSEADLIESLESSADFAETLLTKKKVLAREFGLTAEDVTAARTAAANAKAQRTERSMEGAVKSKDDAATNRAEGRVLFEMRRAMRIFNAAAAKGFGERLVPGPATRHVLAPEKKKAAPKGA
jgi:hypothetical protein